MSLSRSLGWAFAGRLQNGVPLPTNGRHIGVFKVFHSHHTNYGTAELITLLKDAAARVARQYPGSRLMAGNLSRRYGGRLRPSVTHRSGRDVDVAFYFKYRGLRFNARGYYQNFDSQLRSTFDPNYVYDVDRNWAFVRALLTHPRVDVQRIFVARWLKRALIAGALAKGEPAWLVKRARRVIMQPSARSPHAGHFHIRIYCSDNDRRAGCLDRPPTWPWVHRNRWKRRRQRRARRWAAAKTLRPAGASRRVRWVLRRLLRGKRLADLVALTGRTDPVGHVADAELARRTRRWVPGLWPSAKARYAHWVNWCNGHPRRCRPARSGRQRAVSIRTADQSSAVSPVK